MIMNNDEYDHDHDGDHANLDLALLLHCDQVSSRFSCLKKKKSVKKIMVEPHCGVKRGKFLRVCLK